MWAALRQRDPVHRHVMRDGRVYWSLTRYADVSYALRDHTSFTAERGVLLDGVGTDDTAGGRQIDVTDGPRHRPLRDTLYRGPNATLEAYESVARDRIRQIVASWPDGEPFDLAGELVVFPMVILGDLMNLPEQDWCSLVELSTTAVAYDDARPARIALFSYLQRTLQQRRRSPADDLFASLDEHRGRGAQTRIRRRRVQHLQRAARRERDIGAHRLQHPADAHGRRPVPRVGRSAEATSSTGLDEAIRWGTAANHFLRYTTQDVELPGGTIPAGDAVALWLSSANRDEDVFDDPYNFDIRRQPNKHLGFGVGSHYCVGYAMAKLMPEDPLRGDHRRRRGLRTCRSGRTSALEPGCRLRPHPRRRPAPTRHRTGTASGRSRPIPDPNPWVPFRSQQPEARLRLFCFPYSGGGASIYRSWSAALAPDVELCAVQLPGRETRFKDPAATSMSGLVDQVVEGIGPLVDRPFALFGHSFGALVSFETGHRLQSLGFRPDHLFVSGRQAPHLTYPRAPIHQLGEDAFCDEMRRLNGTPEHVLSNPALLSLVIGILRADYTVCETYRFSEGRPRLECPLTAFGGTEDPETTVDDVAGWGQHTGGDFEARMIPGDHFFLHAQEALVLAAVSDRLRL